MTIIWCMVPEIWSTADRIFCHSGLFFALSPSYGIRKSKFLKNGKKTPEDIIILQMCIYHKWQSYDVWFLRHGMQQAEFLVILGHFLPFYPSNNLKIKILKKWKKTPGDTIILYMCPINDNHMMYGFWDMEHNRDNFLSFWTIFCTFTLLTN